MPVKKMLAELVATVLFALWLVTAALPIVNAKGNPFLAVATVHLNVKEERSLGQFWHVRSAYLEESVKGATGYVEIANISGEAIGAANFYGEFYDADGRFCFSLVFSIANNLSGRSGPFLPREVRKLYSTGAFLAPASQPAELRLFILRQDITGTKGVTEAPPLRAPITVQINNP